MANAMRIELGFTGLSGLTQEMGGFVRHLEQAAKLNDQLRQQGGPIVAPAQAGGAGGGRGQGPRGVPLPGGPSQRLQVAQIQYQRALAFGNEDEIFDAQDALLRAQTARDRAKKRMQPPSRWDQLSDLFSSSRINLPGVGGVGVAPLVGKLGLGAAAGPVGLVAAGFTAAASAAQNFATEMMESGRRIGEFARAQTLSGGTTGQMAMATAMGFSPMEAANFSGQLRERIASDPMAAGAAARMGIYTGPQAFGSQNNLRIMLLVAEQLEKLPEGEMRLREARLLGSEALLNFLSLEKKTRDAIKADAQLRARILDSGYIGKAKELNAQLERITFNTDNVRDAFFKPVIGDASQFAERIANTLEGFAEILNSQRGQSGLGGFFGGIGGGLGALDFLGIGALLKSMEKVGQATQQQTVATRQNTVELAGLKQGIFGGKDLARGAMPRYLSGEDARRLMEKKVLGLGAFSL